MYIRRSVQSDDFILLKRQESFNYDSSDTSLPDLSANNKPTGEDNGITLGIVRFCIVLGGILFVIVITGLITYLYRKKLLKSKPKKQQAPNTSTISYILDYYQHDYVEPTKDNGITVVKINKRDISIPTTNEDIQTSSSPPITTSQISAPMPNASVSIYNKERANSLARSVENMNTTITHPVPALASIDDKEPNIILRNIAKESEMLNPTSRESEILQSTSRGSDTLKYTSRGSDTLKYTSRGSDTLKYTSKGPERLRHTSKKSTISRESEIKTLSNATSFDNILPEIFDDSSEIAAPIDINAKWFTYPIDSPTIPLSPTRVPKGSGNNDDQGSSDESIINDIPGYDRKSKRNLRIRIDTFDQFNLTEDKPPVTFTPKPELKKDEKDDKGKSTKVDTIKMIQDVRSSDKYKSFGTSSTRHNQHKRNGSIFEHKYLIRSKTIT